MGSRLTHVRHELHKHRKDHLLYVRGLYNLHVKKEERRVKECFEAAFASGLLDRHAEPRGTWCLCWEVLSWGVETIVEVFSCCGNIVSHVQMKTDRGKKKHQASIYRCLYCRELAPFLTSKSFPAI